MIEQNEAYTRLINILKELFQLDQADLDFGIYRIMNQRRKEIKKFLDNHLVAQVKTTLDEHADKDKNKLKEELTHLEKTLRDAGVDVDANEKVKTLRKQVLQADTTEMQNTTFSHLTNFFKRYYMDGDFISQRRYKDDVYAIPYQGEEVKLHWANHDQYYIKTSEYFKNYRFKLRNGKWVNFELREASTEQNNIKNQNGDRKFKLAEESIFQVNGDTLTIYFTYEPMSKKKKQDKLMDTAYNELKEGLPSPWLTELLQPKPTKKNKNRTVLQKHLKDYTARNTFDYFIHKDLGKFLRRELDFYVKNEILHIDDIDLDKEESYRQSLQVIKAFKKVGLKIIEFLAQLEDFQKQLWLKKKFVLQSDYCITLDRIDEEFYEDITELAEIKKSFADGTEKNQREEWVELYIINELDGYSEPLAVDFLKENPFLMLDTQFFSTEWKYNLLATLDQLDEQTGGLMVNSENFQALKFLESRYRNNIDTIYIDPPYNTSSSEILYKNSFQHSSWLSLIENRLTISKKLLRSDGVHFFTIDDYEYDRSSNLLTNTFGVEYELGTICIRNNPSGRSTAKGVSIAHEYGIVHGKSEKSYIGRLPRTDKQINRYDEKDEIGRFEWVNFRKHGGTKDESPTMYYPFFVSKNGYRIPKMDWDDDNNEWVLKEEPKGNENVLYPIDDKGRDRRWKWGLDRTIENPDEFKVDQDRAGELAIYVKARLQNEGVLPNTWWGDKKYSATSYGTNLIKDIFKNLNSFSYPKSLYAVIDSLRVGNLTNNKTVLDYYAGSGTTGHATIELNREDSGLRKYIMVEMGAYFDSVTKPRIQKVVYSKEWKDGKPVNREGISHIFKYLRLESYEDTLNNLKLNRTEQQQGVLESGELSEEYYLRYMLEVEARESLLNTEMFKRPFGYTIEATKNNERVPTEVDLVETFNYLIGLHILSIQMIRGYVVVTGKNNDGDQILVIWRDTEKHSNQDLDEFVDKMEFNPHDSEFDFIYVNGDNNLQNLRKNEETWKVRLIEEEFHKRMFETEGL